MLRARESKVALSLDGKALAVALNVRTYFGRRISRRLNYSASDTVCNKIKLFRSEKGYM
jgi:hypothetical protein